MHKTVGDTKKQALQKYLGKAKVEFTAHVNQYHPNGRKTEYFRLDYRVVGKEPKSIHICGGNIYASLAQERAKEIQLMIDCGAQLGKIIAAVETYRDGKISDRSSDQNVKLVGRSRCRIGE